MTVRIVNLLLVYAFMAPLFGQESPRKAPIYEVTVLQRTTQAVNYGHRASATPIDFKGTLLYPEAKGKAEVEAKAGAMQIDAKFSKLGTPSRFGPQYLTYVLWAVTPEGNSERLGEIVTNHKDDGRLQVSTSLQTFALIVTAEPYYAVEKPGPIVVMENAIRPETIGMVEPVEARYELLPRSETVQFDVNAARRAENANTPMVSMKEYEALLALYQARNAVQIAQSEDAGIYATETFTKAQALLSEAESIPDRKKDSKRIVTIAREAAQRAEDARMIAAKRKQVDMTPPANP